MQARTKQALSPKRKSVILRIVVSSLVISISCICNFRSLIKADWFAKLIQQIWDNTILLDDPVHTKAIIVTFSFFEFYDWLFYDVTGSWRNRSSCSQDSNTRHYRNTFHVNRKQCHKNIVIQQKYTNSDFDYICKIWNMFPMKSGLKCSLFIYREGDLKCNFPMTRSARR